MDKKTLIGIKAIIEEIEGFSNLIQKIDVKEDPVFQSVITQIEWKKKKRYKELLGLLIQSNIYFEDLNKEIMDYLKKDEKPTVIEKHFASKLQKARKMLHV
ncbi:MAG TPA: hypothetical protein ENJ95_18980 [Bacteroidetes bacterium]|nr:hypothetical protein [Bacteroidota bacterium]